jgi:2-dehydropantoate 2-reductase
MTDLRTAVAVLGPGAVGGSLAVRLVGAGFRTICIARPDTVGLMALAGIMLEIDGGEQLTARPEVSERLEHPVSLLLVTVKAPYLEEALERIDPAAVEKGVVLPLLNGLEHMEPLRERFDGRVAAGSISRFEAYRVGRMQIVQTTPSAVITMASQDLSPGELERAAGILRSVGVETKIEENEKRVLWRKTARLAVLSAATALTRRPVGELREDIEWRPRLEAAIGEACAVAAADGVNLLPSSQWTMIASMDHDLTTSTARDVAAGRRSELDAIAGSVLRAGERLGVPCPVLSELVAETTFL